MSEYLNGFMDGMNTALNAIFNSEPPDDGWEFVEEDDGWEINEEDADVGWEFTDPAVEFDEEAWEEHLRYIEKLIGEEGEDEEHE